MRCRLAPLLLLALIACPRPTPQAPTAIDCAAAGRPDLGSITPIDCNELIEERFRLLVSPGDPLVDRAPSWDPLVAAAATELTGVAGQAREECEARNRCERTEEEGRLALDGLAKRAADLRRLVQEAAPGAPTREEARRQLAGLLGIETPTEPVACPLDVPFRCPDGSCVPVEATCCGDGTHCPNGPCCGDGCCGAGEICGEDGTCTQALACGGDFPQACADGSCAPAGADCCGEGRFCRTGTCCGEGSCCTDFEACVAGRCVPGGATACTDPDRPIDCGEGMCAPVGGHCCGDGRVCETGTCCGEDGCCLSGEQCVEGRCLGPTAANERCGGQWPVTCADGSCAPAGADCCGESRYCSAGTACCGATCCHGGERCVEGACVTP